MLEQFAFVFTHTDAVNAYAYQFISENLFIHIKIYTGQTARKYCFMRLNSSANRRLKKLAVKPFARNRFYSCASKSKGIVGV